MVFVVEDDASVRGALAGLIRSAGWNVEVYSSAHEFLVRPRADVPSCLVLDVGLPGLSGLDLQARMAGLHDDIPIVLITGHGDIPMSVRAMKAGAVEFLTKPFVDQDLLDGIKLAIEPDGNDLRYRRGERFRGGLAGGALRRVRAYIDDHIGERISLDQLARQAGVSRFHFARQFRLSTGESPMGYLRRVRIERSKSILQTRETTIAEVAVRLGFSDQSHFTRIFGRLVGLSPGSFARCDDCA
jgi:AraC-like DNA-binding protein/ActR/RegA family two-component response regulator